MLSRDSQELNGTKWSLGRAGRTRKLIFTFPALVLVFSSKPKDESSGLQWFYSMDGKTIPKSRIVLGLF